ncbi:hypothetical protein NH340_JMT03200 [Sarcoptes scabiei]|nr:hypothetical protein NH340_JMT03200 [Sarcoptes scabiei]
MSGYSRILFDKINKKLPVRFLEEEVSENSFDSLSFLRQLSKLHPNNVEKIWEIFLDDFDPINHDYMRLFSLFLFHIPCGHQESSNMKQFKNLINRTIEKLEKIKQIECDFLMNVFYAIASIKFLSNKFFDSTSLLSDFNANDFNSGTYDLLLLFPQIKQDYWKFYHKNFRKLDQESRSYFIRLILMKYRLIRLYDGPKIFRFDELISLSSHCDRLYRNAIYEEILNFFEPNAADLRAIIRDVLDQIVIDPRTAIKTNAFALLNFERNWESKHFQNIFIEIIVKKSFELISITQKNCIESFINNPLWEKYGCDVPNSSSTDQINLIDSIMQINDYFSEKRNDKEISNAPKSKHDVNDDIIKVERIIGILNECCPLEYLAPYNQIRLIVLLSLILEEQYEKIQLDHATTKNEFKHSLDFIRLFLVVSLRIWNSIRQIWLFDFIQPHLFIRWHLIHLNHWVDEIDFRFLFEKYISTLFRLNQNERIIDSISNLIDYSDSKIHKISIKHILMSKIFLYQNLTRFMQKFQHKTFAPEHVEKFALLWKKLRVSLLSDINYFLDHLKPSNNSNTSSNSLPIYVANYLTDVFERKITKSDQNFTLKKKWKHLLVKILTQFEIEHQFHRSFYSDQGIRKFLVFLFKNRSHFNEILSEGFWRNFLSNLFIFDNDHCDDRYREIMEEKIQSKSYWKKLFRQSDSLREFIMEFDQLSHPKKLNTFNNSIDKKQFQNGDSDYECSAGNDFDGIEDFESSYQIEASLRELIDYCSLEEFQLILRRCLEQIFFVRFDLQTKYCVWILKIAIQSSLTQEKFQVFTDNFDRLANLAMMLLFVANKPENCSKIIVLEFKSIIIKIFKNLCRSLLTHCRIQTDHISALMSVCIEINVYNNLPTIKSSTAMTLIVDIMDEIVEIFSKILDKEPYMILNSMCIAINILTMTMGLLLDIARNWNDFDVDGDARNRNKLALRFSNCSKTFTDLIAKLSKLSEFKLFATHLITFYLCLILSSSKSIVLIEIKENLDISIYKCIDLFVSDQKTLELLYSRIDQKSRDYFERVMDHYQHYYRFKGYV